VSARFGVRLTPRGGADAIDGVTPAGELKVRVRAAPTDGQANRALLELMGRELGVGRTALTIERGATARSKRLRVEGRSADELSARWPGLRTDQLR
jgi:uncharacterized protein